MSVAGRDMHHEFWLADIQDACIIGLDLLLCWGASVDVPRARLHLGSAVVPLQCHQVGLASRASMQPNELSVAPARPRGGGPRGPQHTWPAALGGYCSQGFLQGATGCN